MKSAVELRLRKNGIPVHDEQDAGVLNVQVTLIKLGDNSKPTFIHLIEVEFNQKVALVRQPLVLTTAATWRAGAHGSSNRAQLRGILREGSLMDMVDEFTWLRIQSDEVSDDPKFDS